MVPQAGEEKENYEKKKLAHKVEIDGHEAEIESLKTTINGKEKDFEKIKEAHETKLGSHFIISFG